MLGEQSSSLASCRHYIASVLWSVWVWQLQALASVLWFVWVWQLLGSSHLSGGHCSCSPLGQPCAPVVSLSCRGLRGAAGPALPAHSPAPPVPRPLRVSRPRRGPGVEQPGPDSAAFTHAPGESGCWNRACAAIFMMICLLRLPLSRSLYYFNKPSSLNYSSRNFS